MQIVIDISEEEYNEIEPFLNGETIKGGFNLFRVLKIIKNGTLLSKGHGDLIDRKDLIENSLCKTFGLRRVDIEKAPTIVPADKEGEE